MEITIQKFLKFGILSLELKHGQFLLTLLYRDGTGQIAGKVHAWNHDLKLALKELAERTMELHRLCTKQKAEQDRLLELFGDDDIK